MSDASSLRSSPSQEAGCTDSVKREKRLARNRFSAALHRERQRTYIEFLETSVHALTQERDTLRVAASQFSKSTSFDIDHFIATIDAIPAYSATYSAPTELPSTKVPSSSCQFRMAIPPPPTAHGTACKVQQVGCLQATGVVNTETACLIPGISEVSPHQGSSPGRAASSSLSSGASVSSQSSGRVSQLDAIHSRHKRQRFQREASDLARVDEQPQRCAFGSASAEGDHGVSSFPTSHTGFLAASQFKVECGTDDDAAGGLPPLTDMHDFGSMHFERDPLQSEPPLGPTGCQDDNSPPSADPFGDLCLWMEPDNDACDELAALAGPTDAHSTLQPDVAHSSRRTIPMALFAFLTVVAFVAWQSPTMVLNPNVSSQSRFTVGRQLLTTSANESIRMDTLWHGHPVLANDTCENLVQRLQSDIDLPAPTWMSDALVIKPRADTLGSSTADSDFAKRQQDVLQRMSGTASSQQQIGLLRQLFASGFGMGSAAIEWMQSEDVSVDSLLSQHATRAGHHTSTPSTSASTELQHLSSHTAFQGRTAAGGIGRRLAGLQAMLVAVANYVEHDLEDGWVYIREQLLESNPAALRLIMYGLSKGMEASLDLQDFPSATKPERATTFEPLWPSTRTRSSTARRTPMQHVPRVVGNTKSASDLSAARAAISEALGVRSDAARFHAASCAPQPEPLQSGRADPTVVVCPAAVGVAAGGVVGTSSEATRRLRTAARTETNSSASTSELTLMVPASTLPALQSGFNSSAPLVHDHWLEISCTVHNLKLVAPAA